MILIPLSTDAPIYYWPWMTLVLIAVNAVTFWLTAGGQEPNGWLLTFGKGPHPVEWLASNFLHFGWMHLIGNMIFLWSFGIVVEGKLGWWRYLLVYLLIGIAGGAIVQTAMLGHHEEGSAGSGGASLCIYALLAIAIVWAPKNEMDCFLWIGYRAIMVELSILTLGGLFVALQVFAAWWEEFHISSAMLHLTGAGLGFAVGFVWLKRRWVDCENWDLIAVWNNTYGQPSEISSWQDRVIVNPAPSRSSEDEPAETKPKKRVTIFRPTVYLSDSPKPRKKTSSAETSNEERTQAKRKVAHEESTGSSRGMSELPAATRKALLRMRELLQQGKPQAALAEYRKRLRVIDHWPLDLLDLRALADALYQKQIWDEAVPLMEEFVERFPGRDESLQVRLAVVYCEVQRRPRAAMRLLDGVDVNDLPDAAKELAARVRQKSERLIDDGILELDGKSW